MPSDKIIHLVDRFFSGISRGKVDDELLCADMTFWSINSGERDRKTFEFGIKVLATVANQSLRYEVLSLTAEDDRVVAEVRSTGSLIDGQAIENRHIFLFRLQDGKVRSAAEYMNQLLVKEKIAPLMEAEIAKLTAQ